MRYASVAFSLLVLCFATAAEANHEFRILLHAQLPATGAACPQTQALDCDPASPTPGPVTTVPANTEFELYLIYEGITADLLGWSTSLQWPADWSWLGPNVGCAAGYLAGHEPVNPGGAELGNWAGIMNCTTGPLVLIGHAKVRSGASGCLTQLNSQQQSDCGQAGDGSWKIQALRCDEVSTCIDGTLAADRLRLGSICVGTAGTPDCAGVPVEPATWGKIKATYR